MKNIEKAQAAKKAKKANRAEQVVEVDKGWRIAKIDEYNWQIQRLQQGEWSGWPRENFYGRLIDAARALPYTLVESEPRKSLEGLTGALRTIVGTIEKAFDRISFLK